MNRPDIPDDYEERLASGRRAADRLPDGARKEAVLRALQSAPPKAAVARTRQRADHAEALLAELTGSGFDGTDPERVTWLRLDHTGRLRSLAFSPTIDRLSNPVAAESVMEAWAAAEAARADEAARLEQSARALSDGEADPRVAVLRSQMDARESERFEHTDEDELCAVEVDLRGRLTEFKFLTPNATFDFECETLAAEATAAVQAAQARAGEAVAALVARCLGDGEAPPRAATAAGR